MALIDDRIAWSFISSSSSACLRSVISTSVTTNWLSGSFPAETSTQRSPLTREWKRVSRFSIFPCVFRPIKNASLWAGSTQRSANEIAGSSSRLYPSRLANRSFTSLIERLDKLTRPTPASEYLKIPRYFSSFFRMWDERLEVTVATPTSTIQMMKAAVRFSMRPAREEPDHPEIHGGDEHGKNDAFLRIPV